MKSHRWIKTIARLQKNITDIAKLQSNKDAVILDSSEITRLIEKSAVESFAKSRIQGVKFRYILAGLNAIALMAMGVNAAFVSIWILLVIITQFNEFSLASNSLKNIEDKKIRKNFYDAAVLSAISYCSIAPVGWFYGDQWAKMCIIWFIVGSIVAIAGVQHRVPMMKAKLLMPYILVMPILVGFDLYMNENIEAVPVFALGIMFLTGTVFSILMIKMNFESSKEIEKVFYENEIARIKAENANLAKSQFVSAISHDLRNPLNAILGSANLLKRKAKTKDEIQLLDTLLSLGQGMISLLNDILDHAKLEAGKIEFENIAFSPSDILAETINMWKVPINEKGLEFKSDISQNLPNALIGDKSRINQIINNLLSNAAKFTSKGEVKLISEYQNGKWIIKVIDTGIGISDEEIERLFKPYSQANISTNAKFGGTGLGLANSQKLAQKMGGDIYVKSKPQEGSQFWAELPLIITEEENIIADEAQYEANSALEDNDCVIRVLAADDNKANLFIIGKYLETIGAIVDLAEDGQKALNKSCKAKYDVILLDVRMPNVDGLEACRTIRTKCALNKNTPIIMVSADAAKDQIAIGIEAGADSYLPKPINPQDLFDIIEKSLQGRSAFSNAA